MLDVLPKPLDPYPFQFFNLALAILVGLQGPLIVMSQNRQSLKDRARAETDYKVNLKNEVNIETLMRELAEFRDGPAASPSTTTTAAAPRRMRRRVNAAPARFHPSGSMPEPSTVTPCFHHAYPCIELLALPTDAVQTDCFGDDRTMLWFAVRSLWKCCQYSLRRRRFSVVIDLFGRRELRTDRDQRLANAIVPSV